MGLNIKLLVHGVPYGQKKWGAEEEDSRYLSSFYGPKWTIPEVMKVEIMTFGKDVYCFYTFLKGINVCDFNGRSGSYIALTLKVNAYYADTLNIYNILKAAYEKMIVGLCVCDDGTLVKYLVPDFQDISAQLDNIERSLVGYIGSFSVNSDIISLSNLKPGHDMAFLNINLAECTKQIALDAIQKTGCFFVSPHFLSASANTKIVQLQKEMSAEKQRIQSDFKYKIQQAQEEIAFIKNEAQRKIDECNRQTEKRIYLLKDEHNKEMQDLRESYSNYEIERNGLLRKVNACKSELHEKEKDIKNLIKAQEKDQRKIAELLKKNQKLQENLNLQDGSLPVSISTDDNSDFRRKKVFPLLKRKNCVEILSFLILLFIIIFVLLSENGQKENDIESSKTECVKLKNEKTQPSTTIEDSKTQTNKVEEINKEDKQKYIIDIKELSKKKKYASIGDELTISIKPQEIPSGEILFEGTKVKNGKISVKKKGKYIITYVVDGTVITDRTVEVRDK